MLTGFFNRNKYAYLASIRAAVLMLNLELFLGLLIINCVFYTESFSFASFICLQESVWLVIPFIGMLGLIIIAFLLETNRAPFDLAEAESELVSGYTVEYGGFYFALYYLGEYFHLFFFSMFVVILFFGGWEVPTISFNSFFFIK